MEVVDPFVPSFQPDNNGFGDIPQEWATPFMPSEAVETVSPATHEEPAVESHEFGDETAAVAVSPEPEMVVETVTEPEPAPWTPVDDNGGAVAQAKGFAEKLASTLDELHHALDESKNERYTFLREQAETAERVRGLEAEAARKEEFKALLQSGAGATLTAEDLATLQGMTDALTQDPDRLTLLFNVVQQAPKLATAISVYTQLRQLADRS